MKVFGNVTSYPGPGAYNVPQLHSYNYAESFGSKRFIKPAVKTFCKPVQEDHCNVCSEILEGDYWLKESKDEKMLFCQECMLGENEKAQKLKSKSKRVRRFQFLREFQLVRTCHYYHDHQGTTASVRKLDKYHVKKKIRYENYFLSFN